jgi:protein-S-isoprenylcysteine O-methyltransferase Ste14
MVLSLLGGVFSLGGIVAFRRARTTVNPHRPAKATVLVTTGVYRVTRNPMYLGLVFLLVASTVYLSVPLLLFGPLAFVLYIGRFQIRPEERVLAGLFGAEYSRYTSRVRRWL